MKFRHCKEYTLILIGFVGMLLFTQCGPHHYPRQLTLIDSLADLYPDSAAQLLRQMSPQMGNAPEADRH